jgi:hypothetical protein
VAKQQTPSVTWQDDANASDYDAAGHYLALVDIQKNIDKTVADLKAGAIVEYKATDLLRAAQLTVPKADDRPTREQIKKIKHGEPVAPVLLVRVPALKKVIVADGFHRICAAYRIDPDVVLHCKLAGA